MIEDFKYRDVPELEAEYLAREDINQNIILIGGSYESLGLSM